MPPRKHDRKADRLAKAQILVRLEKMMMRGISNQVELAAAFGVSQQSICVYIKELYERWKTERPADIETARVARVKQLDNIALMALNEFERSKKDTEDFTVTTKLCLACKGDGAYTNSIGETEKCKECGGTGEIRTQLIKLTQKTGDPQYLSVAKACIETAAKMEGVIPPTAKFSGTLMKETRAVGGEIHRIAQEFVYEAPVDVIVKAKAMMDEIKRKMKAGEVKKIESDVIETTAEKVDDDEVEEDE